MLRFFLFNQLFQEAHAVDVSTNRMRAKELREKDLFLSNENYERNYRLSEELMNEVLEDIEHLLKPIQRRGSALTNKTKLLCALAFFAHGSYQRLCKQNIISQPSASRCIHEIVDALNNPAILEKYIKFPQNYEERLTLKERFYEKYKIPGTIGCIGGTFVLMVRPSQNEERFCCRKGYHAINVQLIADADLNIIHVDATNGGASHNSFIFNNSIREELEKLSDTEEMVHLLGDSGYVLRPYLMVPLPETKEGTPEHYYNKIHAKALSSIEQTIDLLKCRFRCLLVQKVLHYDPDKVTKIVMACCVLHNICNQAGISTKTLDTYDQNREKLFHNGIPCVVKDSDAIESALGESQRLELIDNVWRARNIF